MGSHHVIAAPAVAALLMAVMPAYADPSPAPEFGGQDVTALADRQHVATDCHVDWQAKDGKRYCFASVASKAAFLKTPDEMLDKATDMVAAADVEHVGTAMEKFSSDDARALVEGTIKAQADKSGGIYVVDDKVTGTSLPLVYDGVDFTRTLKGYGFFPDVRFHARDEPKKRYLVDFWVVPKAGKLAIEETRIYKAPMKDGADWVSMQRQPKPWWWIPAAEHPGETEDKRSWEVMSAIERYVLDKTAAARGTFQLTDDKTGERIPLELLYVHQPVRKLKSNGHYFACTDFRKAGTKDQYYDIDFWLDGTSGKVSVREAKVHKVPVLKDGSFVQIPRYSFDPKTYDQVP